MSADAPATYDCLACGRCCWGGHDYVPLYAEDLVRLGPVRVKKHVVPSTDPAEQTPYMRMADGHCAALEITPGRYACTVYESRPLRCEVFAPGSPSCLKARESAPPLP